MKKIKYLTELMDDGSLNGELKMGIVALNNACYEQAWDHFYRAYQSKAVSEDDKGKACYLLYCIMERTTDEDEFVLNLKDIDNDLAKVMAKKEVGKDYPRRYIGRKYLEKSAQYGYCLGLIDYSLLCVGYGTFAYKDEMKNVYAGLDWADVMKDDKDNEVRAISYIIYAKYHYLKRIVEYKEEMQMFKERGENADPGKETYLVKEFGKKVLKAAEEDPNNQYVKYYLAILYANVLFSGYEKRKYYNPSKGYDLVCELLNECEDKKLKTEIKEFKTSIEKHYPKLKR